MNQFDMSPARTDSPVLNPPPNSSLVVWSSVVSRATRHLPLASSLQPAACSLPHPGARAKTETKAAKSGQKWPKVATHDDCFGPARILQVKHADFDGNLNLGNVWSSLVIFGNLRSPPWRCKPVKNLKNHPAGSRLQSTASSLLPVASRRAPKGGDKRCQIVPKSAKAPLDLWSAVRHPWSPAAYSLRPTACPSWRARPKRVQKGAKKCHPVRSHELSS